MGHGNMCDKEEQWSFLTFFENIRLAVSVRHTVTVASKPSGTLATMIPIMKTRFSTIGVPMTKPRMRKMMPRDIAIPEMMMMKWWSSLLMGVCSFLVDMASFAIRPMTVWSPVEMTTHLAEPSGTCVPKKHRFCVSRGSSWVHTAASEASATATSEASRGGRVA